MWPSCASACAGLSLVPSHWPTRLTQKAPEQQLPIFESLQSSHSCARQGPNSLRHLVTLARFAFWSLALRGEPRAYAIKPFGLVTVPRRCSKVGHSATNADPPHKPRSLLWREADRDSARGGRTHESDTCCERFQVGKRTRDRKRRPHHAFGIVLLPVAPVAGPSTRQGWRVAGWGMPA